MGRPDRTPEGSKKPTDAPHENETRAKLADLKAQIESKPTDPLEALGKSFEKMGDMFGRLMGLLEKALGGKFVEASLSPQTREIDTAGSRTEIAAATRKAIDEMVLAGGEKPTLPPDIGKEVTENGARINQIWKSTDNPNWLFSRAGGRTKDGYWIDAGGLQSMGRFQLNGSGALGGFFRYVHNYKDVNGNKTDFLAALSPKTRAKALSVAERNQQKGRHDNFFTDEEAKEVIGKIFLPYPWLELNVRGDQFFKSELPYIMTTE